MCNYIFGAGFLAHCKHWRQGAVWCCYSWQVATSAGSAGPSMTKSTGCSSDVRYSQRGRKKMTILNGHEATNDWGSWKNAGCPELCRICTSLIKEFDDLLSMFHNDASATLHQLCLIIIDNKNTNNNGSYLTTFNTTAFNEIWYKQSWPNVGDFLHEITQNKNIKWDSGIFGLLWGHNWQPAPPTDTDWRSARVPVLMVP